MRERLGGLCVFEGGGGSRSLRGEEQREQDFKALSLTYSLQYIEMKDHCSDNVDRLHIAHAR